MASIFLIGGGWEADAYEATYGRFIRETRIDGYRKLLLIFAVERDEEIGEIQDRYLPVFLALGASEEELEWRFLQAASPADPDIAGPIRPTGVFVGGGLTPLYQRLLCEESTLPRYLRENDIPYCGFSAGAAIAARKAIVGGWKIRVAGGECPIMDPELAEETEFLEIRNGLGLTGFPVDVHGSQWGTLSRMVHAVDQGLVPGGWVIDESTMLEVRGRDLTVHGRGQAYFVEKTGAGKCGLTIHRDGSTVRLIHPRAE